MRRALPLLVLALLATLFSTSASGTTGGEQSATAAGRVVVHPRAQTAVTPCMLQGKRPDTCGESLPQVSCDRAKPAYPICVHYTTTGSNATTNGWVNKTLQALHYIYGTYQSAGYRMPLSDGTAGGSSAIDIYLVDLSKVEDGQLAGYYGYCTPTTAPGVPAPRFSAFCVLDSSYSGLTRGHESPEDVMHVTAAHEFFHAVQFGYTADADVWIMEATATWAEDELYTDVNDNRQYLPYSPLSMPTFPMDDSGPNIANKTLPDGSPDPGDFVVYGDWIFFRYLTEHLPNAQGSLPVLVRQIWERMSATDKRPAYSIQAVAAALKADGTSLAQQWAAFTAANRHPQTAYSEGAVYPVAAPDTSTVLRPSRRHRSGRFTLAHLTARTERLTPLRVTGSARLRLTVTAPAKASTITTAVVSVWHTGGSITERTIRLRNGRGAVSIPFASSRVTRAELTLGNAAITYRCNTGRHYACDGTPTGDGLRVSWSATLLTR